MFKTVKTFSCHQEEDGNFMACSYVSEDENLKVLHWRSNVTEIVAAGEGTNETPVPRRLTTKLG